MRIYSLFQIEFLELAQVLLLGLPNSIHNVLDVQDEVCLTIPSISEGHVWWIGLCNGSQSQVGRPCLYQHHVACNQARGIGSASRICPAPEHDSSIAIGRVTEYLVELHSKSVEVANV